MTENGSVTSQMQIGIEKAVVILEEHDCKVTTVLTTSSNGIFAIYFIKAEKLSTSADELDPIDKVILGISDGSDPETDGFIIS